MVLCPGWNIVSIFLIYFLLSSVWFSIVLLNHLILEYTVVDKDIFRFKYTYHYKVNIKLISSKQNR